MILLFPKMVKAREVTDLMGGNPDFQFWIIFDMSIRNNYSVEKGYQYWPQPGKQNGLGMMLSRGKWRKQTLRSRSSLGERNDVGCTWNRGWKSVLAGGKKRRG